jgi:DNA repair protein RecO (recombination protein O)
MSTIEKTEAVVLRSMPYRETSKIVTFYTRRFGRLSTIVKGARRRTSKFGSSLELMAHDLIVVYRKEGRELQTLSECDLLHSYRGLHEDLEKMSAGMAMIELISLLAREEEENAPLFSLLTDSLAAVDGATKNPSHVFYWYEVRIAKILGFQPAFGHCAVCGRSLPENEAADDPIRFDLGRGGPVCRSCTPEPGHTLLVDGALLRALDGVSRAPAPQDAAAMEFDQGMRERIREFMGTYLRTHVHGLRPLKSDKVFSRILDRTETTLPHSPALG